MTDLLHRMVFVWENSVSACPILFLISDISLITMCLNTSISKSAPIRVIPSMTLIIHLGMFLWCHHYLRLPIIQDDRPFLIWLVIGWFSSWMNIQLHILMCESICLVGKIETGSSLVCLEPASRILINIIFRSGYLCNVHTCYSMCSFVALLLKCLQ